MVRLGGPYRGAQERVSVDTPCQRVGCADLQNPSDLPATVRFKWPNARMRARQSAAFTIRIASISRTQDRLDQVGKTAARLA